MFPMYIEALEANQENIDGECSSTHVEALEAHVTTINGERFPSI
jgi:hypothetical protein